MHLSGSGFDRDGQEGSTIVYVGTEVCSTVDYWSTDSQVGPWG